MPSHHFGSGSFKNELWISQKKIFPKLLSVDVEFTTGGAWAWLIADEKGKIVKTKDHSGSGWTSVHLPSLGLYGGFSIGFKNLSEGDKVIKQGDVNYG